MKHLFILILLLVRVTAFTQSTMQVHNDDISTHQLPLAGVDSITFGLSGQPLMFIHKPNDSALAIPLSDIDSVTHPLLWGNPALATLAGQVFNEEGQPLWGVKIKTGNDSVLTDGNGVFHLENIYVNEKMGYITASKSGYFDGSRSFLPVGGINTLKITLLRKNIAGSFSASSGGTVNIEGVSIVFNANTFEQNNTAYTGQVRVAVNFINPESSNFDSEMPGALLGLNNEGIRRLSSFGMIAVKLTDNSGNSVALASGATAQVKFPIQPTQQAIAPSEIDLWYFDELLGYWKKEGTATRSGNEYITTVSHFSFWNCDVQVPVVYLDGTVINALGEGIYGAQVRITSSNNGDGYAYTGPDGSFGGFVPANEALTIHVTINCVSGPHEVYTSTLGSFSNSATLPVIQIIQDGVTLVSGNVIDCDGNPVSNGYVLAEGHAYMLENGHFSIIACTDSLRIQAYNNSPWTAGTPQDIILTSDLYEMGVLQVCGSAGSVSDIDGNIYSTVQIGTQEWMAQNLNTTHYADGSEIPNITEDTTWATTLNGAWCDHDNNPINGAIYGKLYNWHIVNNASSVCPTGWHVPSDSEWTVLTDFLGGTAVAGTLMKSVTGWVDSGNPGTNESGFTGLAAGYRPVNFMDAPFVEPNYLAYWWTSSIPDSGGDIFGYYRNLTYSLPSIYRQYVDKQYGMSIRCVRD